MPESNLFVEIPEHSRTVKAWFEEEPPEAMIQGWKRQIADGTPPYLIDAHTHTRPPHHGRVVYLDEFSIPKTAADQLALSPCPCCRENHLKYRHGKIAWFRDEHVVRFIGPQCFAKLNLDAHEEALEELKKRKARRKEIAYLLRNEKLIRQSYDALRLARVVAYAVRDFSRQLIETIEEQLAIPLAAHIRNGELPVSEQVRTVNQATGSILEQTGTKVYARIDGYRMLTPLSRDYPYKLKQAIQPVEVLLAVDNWSTWVANATDRDRFTAAKLINGMVRTGRTLTAELRDLQRFTTPLTLNTLRTWGLLPESPVRLLIARSGDELRVGRNPNAMIPIKIPSHLEAEIPRLEAPLLSDFEDEAPDADDE